MKLFALLAYEVFTRENCVREAGIEALGSSSTFFISDSCAPFKFNLNSWSSWSSRLAEEDLNIRRGVDGSGPVGVGGADKRESPETFFVRRGLG